METENTQNNQISIYDDNNIDCASTPDIKCPATYEENEEQTKIEIPMNTMLQPKDTLYYARILPNVGYFEVEELHVRTIGDTWFSALEKKTKRAYLFGYNAIDDYIFSDRHEALLKVKAAEELKRKPVSSEVYYEEY